MSENESSHREFGSLESARTTLMQAKFEMHRSVISFGIEAMKIAGLINAAALAAILAVFSKGSASVTADAVGMKSAFACFGFGLACAGLAMALSYVTQYIYATAAEKIVVLDNPPRWERSKACNIAVRIGRVFHLSAIITTASSILLALYGFWLAIQSIG